MNDKPVFKTGMEVMYANERYEIMGIDEHINRMVLYSTKLSLKIECNIDSVFLKMIEEKENK